ncbi:MAG TPA: UbiA family prenyltransferase, partial [Pseudolysinimonas sp.]|nr:UbiA family prenyltransferase [Pseudolysinimonas sp.]
MARLRALALSTHPGPAAAVTLITVLLGIAGGLEATRIVLLGLVMALDQISVGLSNDWIDAGRDRAVGRTDKPVARGDISTTLARNVAFGAALASIALSVPLGWRAVVAHAVFLLSAWAYNAGLKGTVISVLPYVVSFGALPAIVTLAAAQPALAPGWTIAAGALLGAGAHFANVLPDLDDDARTGIRGLPHRLGRVGSLVVTWLTLLAAAASLAVGIGLNTPLGVAGLGIAAAIAVAGLVLGMRRAPTRVLFRLVILAA